MTLIDTWNILKKNADAKDFEVLDRISRAYANSQQRITPEIDALIEQIDAMQQAGKLTKKQIENSAAYKNLIKAIVSELDAYEGYLQTEVSNTVTDNASLGLTDSRILMIAALAIALGVQPKDIPAKAVNNAPITALDYLADYLKKDGELFNRINGLSNYHGEKIAAGILDLVGRGQNPRTIADWITTNYGMGLTDSLRICRTAQLYSYRNASLQVMKSNGELLEGWVWDSELDDDVCPVCISMHGTVHSLDETMDSHYNCRCAPLPWVKGSENPVTQNGEDWLNEQPESTQKDLLGAKYEGWSNGVFELKDVIGNYESDVFGNMLVEKPLKDLL